MQPRSSKRTGSEEDIPETLGANSLSAATPFGSERWSQNPGRFRSCETVRGQLNGCEETGEWVIGAALNHPPALLKEATAWLQSVFFSLHSFSCWFTPRILWGNHWGQTTCSSALKTSEHRCCLFCTSSLLGVYESMENKKKNLTSVGGYVNIEYSPFFQFKRKVVTLHLTFLTNHVSQKQ